MKSLKWLTYLVFALILASSAFALTCNEIVYSDVKMTDGMSCRTNGIIIGADGITIDCNNNAIVGLGGSLSGIEADGKNGITIKNCGIRGFTRGVYLKDAEGALIDSNEMRDNENGIELRSSERITVTNNRLLVNNIGAGTYNSKDITITGNLVRNNQRGIVRYFYTNVSTEGNTFEFNTENVYSFNEVIPSEETEPDEPVPIEETEEEGPAEEAPALPEEIPFTAEELLNETIYLEYRIGDINEDLISEKLEKLGRTSEEIEIRRDITKEGSKTKVTLTIIPKKKLKDLAVYERIPKCFAVYVDLILFEQPPEVLADDPLIKWHFDELDVPAQMVYSTNSLMPEECENLFRAIGLGDIVKPNRWWVALVVLVLVAGTVIYFARYSKK